MNNVEVVIARYNEDVEWVKQFQNYKIYNKGSELSIENIKLPNVGACDHTYLYHIINNYDSLANVTVFLTGGCVYRNDKLPIVNYVLQNAIQGLTCTDTYIVNTDELYNFTIDSHKHFHVENDDPKLIPCEIRPYGKWLKEYANKTIIPNVQYGGIFCVTRDDIRSNPKSYYEKLIIPLSKDRKPEAAHYMERAWSAIFRK